MKIKLYKSISWKLLITTAFLAVSSFSLGAYAKKYMPDEDKAKYRFEDLFTRVLLKQAGIGVIPDIPKLMGALSVCPSSISFVNKKDWDVNCLPASVKLYKYIDDPYFEIKISAGFSTDKIFKKVKEIVESGSLGEYRISDPDGSKVDHVIRAFLKKDPDVLKEYLEQDGRWYSKNARTFPILENLFDEKEERSEKIISVMRKAVRSHPEIYVDERSGITTITLPYVE